MLKMPKHYALNGHRSGCNGVCAEQAGDGPKYEPTNATKPIAATTTPPAALQLRAKDGSVPLLVRAKLHELMDYFPSSESGHDDLAGINADCAMLASMIDLNDAVTEICHMRPNNYSAPQRRRCTEYAIPAPRPPPRISPAYQWIGRSEEHTSELQSLMRISYAVFCLKKKKHIK